jgi:hypothetical protein
MWSKGISSRVVLAEVGRNALALGLVWVLAFGLVQIAERLLGGWPATEIGQLFGVLAGVLISIRVRARVALVITAGLAAFSTSELVIHFAYGIRAAQGGPTHFAVIGAGLLGVILGKALTLERHPSMSDSGV